jgi:hypothetical protein
VCRSWRSPSLVGATLAEPAAACAQPLFVEFVNTLHWYEREPIEVIGTDAELAAWLVERGLPAP